MLPGRKLLPFGYSPLAGAMQVPSDLPKTAEPPLAVGFQLHSALAVGQSCYVSQGRRALLALLQGTAGAPLGSRSAEPQTCGSTALLPQGRQRGSLNQALLFLSHQPAAGFPQISDSVKLCCELFGKRNFKMFS